MVCPQLVEACVGAVHSHGSGEGLHPGGHLRAVVNPQMVILHLQPSGAQSYHPHLSRSH